MAAWSFGRKKAVSDKEHQQVKETPTNHIWRGWGKVQYDRGLTEHFSKQPVTPGVLDFPVFNCSHYITPFYKVFIYMYFSYMHW